jgi:hypothetical protein
MILKIFLTTAVQEVHTALSAEGVRSRTASVIEQLSPEKHKNSKIY